jgi:hypothetical protein
MRYPAESDVKLTTLLDAARQEPVFIERDDRSVAVMLSVEEYDRLRGIADDDFQAFCDSVSDRALAQGLTEAGLEELLNHA